MGFTYLAHVRVPLDFSELHFWGLAAFRRHTSGMHRMQVHPLQAYTRRGDPTGPAVRAVVAPTIVAEIVEQPTFFDCISAVRYGASPVVARRVHSTLKEFRTYTHAKSFLVDVVTTP